MIELAGIEACPLSEWLHRGLRETGIPIVCVETRHAQRFLSSRPVKTDKNDACGIAEMMRLGHYRPVHVKSPAGAVDAHDPRRPDATCRLAAADRGHDPRVCSRSTASRSGRYTATVSRPACSNCSRWPP
jgi:hypothetical protein